MWEKGPQNNSWYDAGAEKDEENIELLSVSEGVDELVHEIDAAERLRDRTDKAHPSIIARPD